MFWQPIETAPKDGSEGLAAVRYPNKGRYVTFFLYWIDTLKEYPDGVWAFDYKTPLTYGEPAYWMETPQYVEPSEELKEFPQPGTITLSGPGSKRWKEIYQSSPPPEGVELS